jgi:hypothetical protein
MYEYSQQPTKTITDETTIKCPIPAKSMLGSRLVLPAAILQVDGPTRVHQEHQQFKHRITL